ncbi:MAG: flagellar hook-length control protein FliK [Pseudobutyrivibrio sp.]|uniref:flagellar hook-length control protein FliK n=1 Tax=Pseudobutyrivibrio sp. TaxID=2014367 RepID=UPI001B037F0E|nr:flagellar hook-length control protein FliK [Pseudobutyrivibrio sp.]MBO5617886.1 flagellar hook-length control protein FliK [Pseudobutyrivibrio sp.]MBO6283839.1 flagellar hook-length control protein FliK [Pseudobutyrivibrio sp.]MBP3263007.1 flagellar hook-length control protein FliK [Pseudobutyrivibrio sp.]
MTSSNVSNLLVQVKSINVEMPAGKVEKSGNATLFENTLKNIAGSNLQEANTSKAPDVKTVSADNTDGDAAKKLKVTKENKLDNTTSTIDADKETEGKIEEASNQIKEIIEDELDVSEEDIEKALENLGFTLIDLFNPQNLAEVVATLTGEEDSIALVMSEEFKTILDSVNELTDQLLQETNLSFEDFKEIIASVEPRDENKIEPTLENETKKDIPEITVEIKDEVELKEVKEQPIEPAVKESIKEPALNDSKVEVNEEEVHAIDYKENAKPQDENNDTQKQFENRDSSFKASEIKVTNKSESKIHVNTEGMVFAEPKVDLQFSVKEQIISLPSGETVKAEEIINQLVEQARVLSDAETTTMEMTLNPEGLGKIFMEVTQKGNEITAKIFTENDAVKQALESQMANLKLEMNQSSTKVTSIEVSVGTHEFERNLEEDARNQQQNQEQDNHSKKRTRGINLNSLDELAGLMSEEDALIAQMMLDNGNTLDYQA